MSWGLLAPAMAVGERRTRTLELGAVVRRFNELTVPGIGGVWFGKQLLWPALGILVADHARRPGGKPSKVECANAVEAAACWLGLHHRRWQSDPRLRGSNKMPRQHALDFKSVSAKRFYVTQPMRMATVQAMLPLGLAQAASSRFNAFELTEKGMAFVRAACEDYRPYKRDVATHLQMWVQGEDVGMNTRALHDALSPTIALSDAARAQLRDALVQGSPTEAEANKTRRRDALAWVETVHASPSAMDWKRQPSQISAPHWADMLAGARLFAARDAAIALLDALERQVAQAPHERWRLRADLPEALLQPLEQLKTAAASFLELDHRDEEANLFCRQCVEGDAARILSKLVARDGRVLRHAGDEVVPGSAFRRTPPQALADDPDEQRSEQGPATAASPGWPPGISYRIDNLYLLSLDLLRPDPDDKWETDKETRLGLELARRAAQGVEA